ncbi:MAG: DUF721 domain-containing protein [Firmicutes bacterium]|nr:DUF721 domain-containing protein [Bacillota bacterium]
MDKLGKVLDFYFEKIGLQEQIRQEKWLQKWPEVVGRHICRYARPLALKGGVLWVEVYDSNWLYHLTMLREKIKDDFNKIIGFEAIKGIKMTNAGSVKQEREINYASEKSNSAGNRKTGKKIILEQQELDKIEKLVETVPWVYKEKFRDLCKHSYLQQKIKREEGAISCRVCGVPCYKNEIREDLCLFCFREYEKWIKLLEVFFEKRPWLTFNDLKKNTFPPRKELYQYCKEKIRKKYFEQIMRLSTEDGLHDKEKKKELKKIILHYIVFVAEKEPSLIQPEDEFRALKDFGGLFKHLEVDKLENNNDYNIFYK